MILTLQNGIKYLVVLLFISCSENRITFYELQEYKGDKIEIQEYYTDDEKGSLELRAVQASLRGEYRKSLDLTSKLFSENNLSDNENHSSIVPYLKSKISDITTDEETKLKLEKLLKWYQGIETDSIFKNFKNKSALNAINQDSRKYHFTLINEAHYSHQHRSFTNSLLKPLWENGYRYLALEGIGYDNYIQTRGYAVNNSGYYTRESSFANLIRHALEIGYIIVPYESRTKNTGSSRDFEQAENLINATYKNDKNGKVLVHAGYSHIREIGDRGYVPLGAQLKKLINMDILTVDQEVMSERGNPNQENSYYKFVLKNFEIKEPTVFLNPQETYLVDPINENGIDIQIYQPRTSYVLNRPEWLINDTNAIYPLPKNITILKGYFVQAIKEEELEFGGIPYDQFVIDADEKGIILEKGMYVLRIFNPDGHLKKISKIKINF
ncbi:MAG: hypothetical protein ACSHW7_02340 [Patiriisocius sp.]|uniref:hypothetical protein n=1 Tax=Patiriisocius sp. TaxID=2822396 RepID=UPI003EF12D82